MASATGSTKAFGTSTLAAVEQNRAGFTTLGLAAVAFGGALAFGLTKAANAAFEFEEKLVRIQTLVGLSKGEVDRLGESVLALAGKVGVGPTELADALYFVTSSGFEAAEAMTVVEASAKAAAIGLGTTGEVADAVTSVMNAYGHEVYTASQVTDILAAAVNKGKLEANELAPVLGNIVPIASALGIGFEDVAGTLAVLSLRGTDAAEGATMVSGVLSSLLATTPKVTEALDSVGLSMADLREVAAEQGLFGVMQLLNRAFEGNIEALREIFPNIRAFRAVMSALSGDVSSTRAVLDAVANSTGTVNESFKEWGETATAAKAKFVASFEAMMVVLGTVFLPVLSKVFDAFRGFADFISSLPGPAKTVAVALVAIGAAIGLVGGAALLALPRIVAIKGALASVAGTPVGGALRGFASFLAGPWGIALAGATVGLGIWAAGQEAARRRVEELTAAIEADSGAIGANTKELVVNRLEREGLLDAATTLGIALPDVVDAALGEADAVAKVNEEIRAAAEGHQAYEGAGRNVVTSQDETSRAASTLVSGLRGVGVELDAAMEAAERHAEAVGGDAEAQLRLSDVTDDTTVALEGMQAMMDLAEEAAGALETALDSLAGATIAEEKAAIDWRNSLVELHKELKAGEKTLDINTQAGRDNREAILAAVDAAIEHGKAVAEETGSVEKGARAVRKHIEELVDEAIAAGIAKEDIKDYIRQLNLTPSEIKTTLKLLGLEQAQGYIDSFIDRNTGRTVYIDVQGRTIGGLQHAGGPIYHEGGLAGLRSDEVPAILQTGEFVINRRSAARLGTGFLSMLNRMHAGGPTPIFAASRSSSAPPTFPSGDLVLEVDGQALARIARSELLKLKGSRVTLGLS